MTDLYMRRVLTGLEPADDEARLALKRFNLGDTVRCEITKPRNLQFHKHFFAMLEVVWTSCGNWNSKDEFLRELKFRVGHVDKQRVVDPSTGEVLAELCIPKSISFAAMDQFEFERFYNRCIHEICTNMVPGLNDSVLREEVLKAVGLPMPEAKRA